MSKMPDPHGLTSYQMFPSHIIMLRRMDENSNIAAIVCIDAKSAEAGGMGRIYHHIHHIKWMKGEITEHSRCTQLPHITHNFRQRLNQSINRSFHADITGNRPCMSLFGKKWSLISFTLQLHGCIE